MGEGITHEDVPEVSGPKQTRCAPAGDRYFALHVNDTFRYAETITPGTSLLTGGYCDAIQVDAATTVTLALAENPTGTPIAFILPQGSHRIAAAKITPPPRASRRPRRSSSGMPPTACPRAATTAPPRRPWRSTRHGATQPETERVAKQLLLRLRPAERRDVDRLARQLGTTRSAAVVAAVRAMLAER